LGVHAGHRRFVASALEVQLIAARRDVEIDLLVGERGHEVGQQAGGDRDRSFLLDLGADPVRDGHRPLGEVVLETREFHMLTYFIN